MNYRDYLCDLLTPTTEYLNSVRDNLRKPVFRGELTSPHATVTLAKRYLPEIDKSLETLELLDAMEKRHKICLGKQSKILPDYSIKLQYNREKYNALIHLMHELTHGIFFYKGYGENDSMYPFTHEIAPFVTERFKPTFKARRNRGL
jgi:hypothetical protein